MCVRKGNPCGTGKQQSQGEVLWKCCIPQDSQAGSTPSTWSSPGASGSLGSASLPSSNTIQKGFVFQELLPQHFSPNLPLHPMGNVPAASGVL